MLSEIICRPLRALGSGGDKPGTFRLRRGLNAVLVDGASLGVPSFLALLDCGFGLKSYAEATALTGRLGGEPIEFGFDFGDGAWRMVTDGTSDDGPLAEGAEFRVDGVGSLDAKGYREWLAAKYGFNLRAKAFRDMLLAFARHGADSPLDIDGSAPRVKLSRLEKLFGVYKYIFPLAKQSRRTAADRDTYLAAHSWVPEEADMIAEQNANEERLKELQGELAALAANDGACAKSPDRERLESEIKRLRRRKDICRVASGLRLSAERAEQRFLVRENTVLAEVGRKLAGQLKRYADYVYGHEGEEPTVYLKATEDPFIAHHEAHTARAIFDLSLLALTNLPFIAYEASFFAAIDDEKFVRLMGLYEKSGKQAIVTADKGSPAAERLTRLIAAENLREVGLA